MPTFLDTHAWVWWVTEDRRMSGKALAEIRKRVRDEGVWISAISVWEVAKKAQKGHLQFDRPVGLWLDQATRVAGLHVAELTVELLRASCELPAPFHGDPADQIIAATVLHHRGHLITRDKELHRYPHLKCVW